jgi:hypothetical protein
MLFPKINILFSEIFLPKTGFFYFREKKNYQYVIANVYGSKWICFYYAYKIRWFNHVFIKRNENLNFLFDLNNFSFCEIPCIFSGMICAIVKWNNRFLHVIVSANGILSSSFVFIHSLMKQICIWICIMPSWIMQCHRIISWALVEGFLQVSFNSDRTWKLFAR